MEDDSPSIIFPENDERCEFRFERDGSTKHSLKDLICAEAQSLKEEKDAALVMKQTNVTSSTMRIRGRNKGATPAKAESEMAEWLSAAAQASEYQGQNTVFKSTHSSAARRLENEDASERAMKMMQSPSRKRRTSSTAPSNPRETRLGEAVSRKAIGTVSKTQEVPDGLRGRAVGGATTVRENSRKPPTVPRSPKFSVLLRRKTSTADVAHSTRNPSNIATARGDKKVSQLGAKGQPVTQRENRTRM